MLSSGLKEISFVVEKIFTVIFSTPLSIFYLSLFNYFTLMSLYVLLDVTLPDVVFDNLEIIYRSSMTDSLRKAGFSWRLPRCSEERVTDPRPLYFSVTSDLLPENFNKIILFVINVVFFEFSIFFLGKFKRLEVFSKIMVNFRGNVYMGLIAGKVMKVLLTWRYSFFGTYRSYGSKVTLGAQYIFLYLFPFIGLTGFLEEIEKARKKNKRYILLALHNWWPVYEAFIFPIVVLLPHPLYFMVIIGLGHLLVFYNAFYITKYRCFAFLKASYAIIIHGCFFIFMFCRNNEILANISVIYLLVLLIGSIHQILEKLILTGKGFFRLFRKICKENQVTPLDFQPKA